MQGMSGDALLEEYTARWDYFQPAYKLVNNICNYLNRYYIKRAQESETSHIVHHVFQVSEGDEV